MKSVKNRANMDLNYSAGFGSWEDIGISTTAIENNIAK